MGKEESVAPATVIPTRAGELQQNNNVKWIFHVASVVGQPREGYRPIERIERCITNVLRRADTVEFREDKLASILFPILGTGPAGGDLEKHAECCIQAAVDYLESQPNSSVSVVYFYVWSNIGLEVCQRIVARASSIASAIPMPAVPDKSTASPAEKDVAGFSQTLNSPDRSVSRYDFFIAYATPDRRLAQDLCWFLQDDACKVFLDVQDLSPGAVWPPALREALEASRAIVVLVSTHADDAFYQQEEIVRAMQLARDKPSAHTVIPVILEKPPQGTVSMPYGMSSLQAYDATRAGGLSRVAAELVAWLNDH
jgi:O-acetyl-ADP-ribose deacetylase (regulator of RNase III)